jgi:N-acetyl-D-muramate 6-phosphate phosphatase
MALDLARIRAICFDVDGTLSDTDDQWVSAFEQRLRGLRRLFPRGEVRPFARWAIMCAESPGNLLYHLMDRANLDAYIGRAYNYLCQHQVERRPGHFWLIPGVREALEQLKPHYPMAVVSARGRQGTLDFLAQYELERYFQSVATALTCQYTKPFPDPVLWAAQQMAIPPEHCLMVGDTTVDIRAGKSAGAQTVGVLCGFGQENELRRAGADLILPCTADLAEVLLQGSNASA